MRIFGPESDAGWICTRDLGGVLGDGRLPTGMEPSRCFSVSCVFGLDGGEHYTGTIVWDVEPGDEGPFVDDLLDAVGLRAGSRELVDVIYGGPDGCIHESQELLVDGGRYTLLRRACPRCTLCRQCCTRSGPHTLCAHTDHADVLAHLWYLVPASAGQWSPGVHLTVQGHISLAGINMAEEIFGRECVQQELRQLREDALSGSEVD